MARPHLYLDENVAIGLADVLRARGYSVTTVAAERTFTNEDDEQLAYAARHGLLLITRNGKHFKQWHQAYLQQRRWHSGIVVLPQRTTFDVLALRALLMLDWVSTLPSWSTEFFTWGAFQEKLEQGYRLPGYSEDEIRLVLGRPATSAT